MEKMAGGRPVARNTEFFKKLKNHGSSGGKAVYTDENGFFYTWDSWHGEWEKFSRRGEHVGALDENGVPIKEAVKGRHINV